MVSRMLINSVVEKPAPSARRIGLRGSICGRLRVQPWPKSRSRCNVGRTQAAQVSFEDAPVARNTPRGGRRMATIISTMSASTRKALSGGPDPCRLLSNCAFHIRYARRPCPEPPTEVDAGIRRRMQQLTCTALVPARSACAAHNTSNSAVRRVSAD